MIPWLARIFRLQPGEFGLSLTLGALLLVNSLAMQVSYVSSVSGFLSEGGVNGILIVWLISYALVLLITGLQSLIVDRFSRRALMRWLCLGFALAFLGLRLMFYVGAPGWLNFSLLYLLADQQWLFFPLVFWTLANDKFSMAQAKRLFPLLAGWGFIGQILGLSLAASAPGLVGRLGLGLEELLSLNAVLYLLAYPMALRLKALANSEAAPAKAESLRETLLEGLNFVRQIPSFRHLTVALLAVAFAETIIEFRFLVVTDAAFPSAEGYQVFYGLWRLAITLLSFALQVFVTSRLISRLSLKNTFLVAPLTVLAGALWLLVLPGLSSGVGALTLLKLVRDTLDDTARRTFQSLVPSERRGRVSIFMDSYLLALGTMAAAALTFVTVQVGLWLELPAAHLYLGLALAAAALAVWASYRMRGAYESSMLNWRLRRRQRGASVLEKLEF